jgi:DNA-binding NtrC family response regulator
MMDVTQKTILVVDDDPDILALMCEILSPQHAVLGVRSGEDALVALDHHRFDLLITDLRMPEMHGFQLIRFARERQPGIVVVIVSAYCDTDDATTRRALRQYATAALTKPLHHRAVSRVIASALHAR